MGVGVGGGCNLTRLSCSARNAINICERYRRQKVRGAETDGLF